jgi:hypothetical protein
MHRDVAFGRSRSELYEEKWEVDREEVELFIISVNESTDWLRGGVLYGVPKRKESRGIL